MLQSVNKALSNCECIYEVNCVVDSSVSDEFLEFLKPHALEVASLDGFLSHEILLTGEILCKLSIEF